MISIIMVIIICAAASAMCYKACFGNKLNTSDKDTTFYVCGFLIIAAAVRIMCAKMYFGMGSDWMAFARWATNLQEKGLGEFYSMENEHIQYPPLYVYVLWIIGEIRNLAHLSDSVFYALMKVPPIVCDLVSGIVIYKIAEKKLNKNQAIAVMAVWLFNPALLTDSALWGQVDVLYTFFVGLMLYFIAERKLIYSYYVFAICLLLKPQALFIAPVMVYGIIEQVFIEESPEKKVKTILEHLIFGLSAIAMMVIISAPFGINKTFEQYKETVQSSSYITQNAFNLWGAMGKNYEYINGFFGPMGNILLVSVVAFSAFVYFKSKEKSKVYISGAIMVFFIYMLSVKMNERYAFTAMILLLLAFIERPNLKNFTLYTLITLSQFFNIAYVLFVIWGVDYYKYYKSPVIVAASIINVTIFAYMVYVIIKDYCYAKKTQSVALDAETGNCDAEIDNNVEIDNIEE